MPRLRLVAMRAPTAPIHASAITGNLQRELRDFAVDFIAAMAKYPPQQPTYYRRTGDLGRAWKIERTGSGRGASITVSNAVSSRRRTRGGGRRSRRYAVYVQGPAQGSELDQGPGTRQAGFMASKGWQNMTDVSDQIWRIHQPRVIRILQQ